MKVDDWQSLAKTPKTVFSTLCITQTCGTSVNIDVKVKNKNTWILEANSYRTAIICWEVKADFSSMWRRRLFRDQLKQLTHPCYITDSISAQSTVWKVLISAEWLTLIWKAQLQTRRSVLAKSPILPAIFTGYLPNRGMLEIFIVLMALYIGLRSSVRRGRRGGRLLL